MEIVEHIFLGLAYIAVIGFLVNGLDDLFYTDSVQVGKVILVRNQSE